MRPTRRSILTAILAAPPALLMRVTSAGAQSGPRILAPTPSCGEDAGPTVQQIEGPFFRPSAPLKRDLRGDAPNGSPIILAGFVVDTSCRSMPNALVEIWHADESGAYDNAGFRLRARQLTDERGRWGFTTIVPAPYPGRTPHYHFKVQPRGGRILTTQLYFPDEPRNREDQIFDARLLLALHSNAQGRVGRFDFVV